jgi:NAD(P)-dependent dehydrogenase (short-subunit alcohol dehydrogenase family)
VRITDSVVMVSGAASGLGRATAHRFAADGATVVLVDLPGERLDAAAAELADAGDVVAVPADVTSEDQLAQAVATAADHGPLRVAVACAGIAPPTKIYGKRGVAPLEGFQQVLAVNLAGTFNLFRLAAQAMVGNDDVDGDKGVLIGTASVAAFDGQVGQAAYAASKGGVAAMTLPVARDLAEHHIRVMTIAPGIMDTPMMAGLPENARVSLAQQIPHPARLGRPEEYAMLAAHIVANPLLNGEVIRLDGAIRMAPR